MGDWVVGRRIEKLLILEGSPIGLLRGKWRWTGRKLHRLQWQHWSGHCSQRSFSNMLVLTMISVHGTNISQMLRGQTRGNLEFSSNVRHLA